MIEPSRGLTIALLLCLMALAGGLRALPYLSGADKHFIGSDGMFENVDATYIAKTGDLPSLRGPSIYRLMPGVYKLHSCAHHVLLGYCSRWTGISLVTVIKILGTIATSLAVLLIYLIGSKMFDKRVGFLSALFLAVSPQHVWLSFRFDEQAFALPLFMLAVFLMVAGQTWLLLLSVVALAFVHGTSTAIFIQVYAMFAFADVVTSASRNRVRQVFRHFIVGTMLFGVFCAGYDLRGYEVIAEVFGGAYRASPVRSLEAIRLIGSFVCVLSAPGIFFLARQYGLRSRTAVFLIVWVAYVGIFSHFVIWQDPPRFLGFAAPCVLFASVGFLGLWDLVGNPRWAFNRSTHAGLFRVVGRSVLILLLIVAAATSIRVVVSRYKTVLPDGYPAELGAVSVLRELPVNTSIVVNQIRPDAQITFLAGVTSVGSALRLNAMDEIFKGTNVVRSLDILRDPEKYEDRDHVIVTSCGKVYAPEFARRHHVVMPNRIDWVVFVCGRPGLFLFYQYPESFTPQALEKFKSHPELFEEAYARDGVHLFRVL